MGSAILYILYLKIYFEKKPQKITTLVRFSDNYLNIPLSYHSFLISLQWDSYALNCLPLAYPSDI